MNPSQMIAGALLMSTFFCSCDKNEFAPEIADQEFTLEENSPVGTLIGIVDASDKDEGQVLTFGITHGNEDGIFEINPNIGSLKVADPAQLDYETKTQYILTVTVSDGNNKESLESSATIKINISDVNEYAPNIESQTFIMDENPPNGYEIGVLTATDIESHQSLIFSIAGLNEEGYFQIDPQSGALSVADSSGFDFETNEQLKILVKVNDDHPYSLSDTAYVTVTINDVFEIPQGLIASYPFDGNPDDVSGNDHNGIIHGAALAQDRFGNNASAYFFDGNLSYIDLGNAAEMKRYQNDYTVTGWIKLNDYSPTYHSIIMSNRNPNTTLKSGSLIGIGGLQSSVSKRLEFIQNATVTTDEYTYDYLSSNTQMELDTWYFFCLTYEYLGNLSNTVKIYVNGNLESQKMMGEILDPMDAPNYLGCEPELAPVEYSFDGSMDGIEMYNRALSDKEIKSLYNK